MTVAEFIEQCKAETHMGDFGYEAWRFGDDPDTLARLVAEGIKTATCSLRYWYETGEEPMPRVGEYSVILDAQDRPVCLIRTTNVYTVPFDQASEEHAFKEGEGDRSYAYWRRVHVDFFSRELRQVGLCFHASMEIVCEEFELICRAER